MPDDLGSHRRNNRKTRHLITLLRKTRVKSIRMKILEELRHEFERSRVKPGLEKLRATGKRGAIGVSGWGKRTVQRGEAYAKSPARRNHTWATAGAYARQQAVEREKNRPARDAAKLARRQQRDAARLDRQKQRKTRRAQRAAKRQTRPVTGVRARIQAAGATRQGQKPAARKPAARKPATAARTAQGQPVIPARPAAGAREARAATPATRTPRARAPQGTPVARPARAPRTSRTSKTG